MRRSHTLRLFVTGTIGFLIALGLAPVGASSANISHSYNASTNIANGSLVSLDPVHSGYVQPANVTNGTRLLGVAVASNDSLLAVDSTQGNVQVATSGTANTLVSTLDGSIDVGDRIAVSPFNGIGMKSVTGSYDIGLAQTAFNSSSKNATTEQVTSKNGQSTRVQVGYIRLTIAVGIDNSSGGQSSLDTLQKIVKSLTGRTISTVRVVISFAVTVVALIALITLIYASIYGSIISIGRNPLAKNDVFVSLASVVAVAVLLVLVAGVTVFLLLR